MNTNLSAGKFGLGTLVSRRRVTANCRRDAGAPKANLRFAPPIAIFTAPSQFFFAIATGSANVERIKNSIMYKKSLAVAAMLGALTFNAGAWDYEGITPSMNWRWRRLPADFGGFTPEARDKEPHCVSRGRTRPLAECGRFAAETFQRAGPLH